MKDFSVKVTVRNGRLLNAILEKHPTCAAFARSIGRTDQSINGYVSMRVSPLSRGDWSEPARDIAAALGKYPEELWPKHMERLTLRRNSGVVEMDIAEVEAVISGNFAQRELIERWSAGLNHRDRIAIAATMEGATLEEMAKDLGVVSRERARQIQARAIRKMRKAALKDGVRDFTGAVE